MADLQRNPGREKEPADSAGPSAIAGRRAGCIRFWSHPVRLDGIHGRNGRSRNIPAYVGSYHEDFICQNGRHASLLTYDELLACLEGPPMACPMKVEAAKPRRRRYRRKQ